MEFFYLVNRKPAEISANRPCVNPALDWRLGTGRTDICRRRNIRGFAETLPAITLLMNSAIRRSSCMAKIRRATWSRTTRTWQAPSRRRKWSTAKTLEREELWRSIACMSASVCGAQYARCTECKPHCWDNRNNATRPKPQLLHRHRLMHHAELFRNILIRTHE